MGIANGYTKYKRYMKQSDGTYKLQSLWTSANTVHFDDGSTVQTNLGNIKGITSDLTCKDHSMAASMYSVNQVNTKVINMDNNVIYVSSFDASTGTLTTKSADYKG